MTPLQRCHLLSSMRVANIVSYFSMYFTLFALVVEESACTCKSMIQQVQDKKVQRTRAAHCYSVDASKIILLSQRFNLKMVFR